MEIRRTYVIVTPSYTNDPAKPETELVHNYLVKCRVLPKPLPKYIYEKLASLKQLIHQDDLIISLDGTVTAKQVEAALKTAACECDVLVILFVGHGVLPSSPGSQATLVLSHRQSVTAQQLRFALSTFKGTLIEILNTCHADGLPPAAENEAVAASHLSPSSTTTNPVITLLSSENEGQTPQHGCAFLEVVRKLFEEKPEYGSLENSMKLLWTEPVDSCKPVVKHAHRYEGEFLSPAKEKKVVP